jgi:ParB family chromosome partitioning protein
MLLAGDIDMGHARALLAVDAAIQIQLANQIIAKRLSVRDAEALVTRTAKEPANKPAAKQSSHSRDVTRLEETLSDQLGTKVSLKVAGKGRGQLIIEFHGWDHCSSIIEKLNLKEEIDA